MQAYSNSNLTINETVHEPCGEPVRFDVERRVFISLADGSEHVCSEIDAPVCDCGAILVLSRFGRVRDRATGQRHLCSIAIDQIERQLAFDRRSWRR